MAGALPKLTEKQKKLLQDKRFALASRTTKAKRNAERRAATRR